MFCIINLWLSGVSALSKVVVEISNSRYQNRFILDLVYTHSKFHLRRSCHSDTIVCSIHEGFMLPLYPCPVCKGKVLSLSFLLSSWYRTRSGFGIPNSYQKKRSYETEGLGGPTSRVECLCDLFFRVKGLRDPTSRTETSKRPVVNLDVLRSFETRVPKKPTLCQTTWVSSVWIPLTPSTVISCPSSRVLH